MGIGESGGGSVFEPEIGGGDGGGRGKGPWNGFEAHFGEQGVGAAEAAATPEMADGQGRRMAGDDGAVVGVGEEGFELACVIAPKKEHDPVGQLADDAKNGLGEGLPALAAMGSGGSGANGQDCIEEENAGPGPGLQATMGRGGNSQVLVQFAEDVAQGGGQRADFRLD